ncbi:MAG: tetratricopeptide repeat protein [Muribaculaceae bacterium]|nr:tetratricopeptide repeat protein [Muribaculaceae bacterium]
MRITEQLENAFVQKHIVHNASEQLLNIENSIDTSIDSLYAVANRQIETLALAGGSENVKKMVLLVCNIADVNSKNIEWQLIAGNYMQCFNNDYVSARNYYLRALSAEQEHSNGYNIDVTTIYTQIGDTYYQQGDEETALIYFLNALDLMEKEEAYSESLAFAYDSIGDIYESRNDLRKAIEYNLKGVEIGEKVKGRDSVTSGLSYMNIGRIFNELGQYDDALEWMRRA